MKKKPILSKGLKALLSDDDLIVDDHVETQELYIDQIVIGDLQPRKDFSIAKLEELSVSIKEFGVLQPILVRPVGNKYEIVAGERRYRASKMALLNKIPVKILELEPQRALSIAIIENIQRSDLNILEEAMAFNRLLNEYNYSHQQIANVLGKSRSEITNKLQVLKLEKQVQSFLAQEKISFGHVKLLSSLEENLQLFYANKVIKEHLSVRQLERLLSTNKNTKNKQDINVINLQKKIEKEIGVEAKIVLKNNKSGKISINFPDLDFLEKLLCKLGVN